jgi:selenocysteine-specific elongation factor
MHVIGTAGHVDHGKSTLVERLTGIDPDRFAEEKRRGLTIDLGFAWLILPSGNEVGIIDVPGHERFIKNMLAGAGGVSICLFVVAATEGWKPQSAEHLAILDVLGVTRGVVALTKCDLAGDAAISAARVDIEARLEPTSLAGLPIVACSALTGDGVGDLVAALDRVVEAAPTVPDLGRPRLWVDRVFTITGAGTVVTGTLIGGSLASGDKVSLIDGDERRDARIRKIQSHKKLLERVAPGNRVALNLAGLERDGAERGSAVVGRGGWMVTRQVHAVVRVLGEEVTGTDHELTDKGAHLLYVGSAETPVRLRLLDKDRLRAGESGLVELSLRDPLPLARGDRFVLRDAGRVLTFGGGEVLDPGARNIKRSETIRIEALRELIGGEPGEALEALVRAEGRIRVESALFRSGATEPGDSVPRLGDSFFSTERIEDLERSALAHVERHHRDHPLDKGINREALRSALELDPAELTSLVARIPALAEEEAVVRLVEHRVRLAPAQEAARSALLAKLEASGFSPPLTPELDADRVLLRALSEAGDIVKIDGFYLTASQARAARAKVRAAIETSGPLTVAQIRDVLGTTRKYAVPLCEWLDASGATRRQGDTRGLGPRP